MPCDNAVRVKNNEYKCLGHHLKFHGDGAKGHKFWTFLDKLTNLPENYLKFDYVDEHSSVCSHNKHIGKNEYECLGHTKGDPFIPVFHGNAKDEYRFWVYPPEKKLGNPLFHFRTPDVCENKRLMMNSSDGV
jgi:hypothetical protein